MIAKLVGIVDRISLDSAVIIVGGVGYLANCSNRTLSHLKIGENAALIIETRVREDAFQLFGFCDEAEKNWFLKLTTVNGVGNKLALTILSYLSLESLSQGLLAADKDVFKIVPGVGPKLGVRIIAELAGKIDADAPLIGMIDEEKKGIAIEAVSALVNLGYKKNEAADLINKILKDNKELTLSELIMTALKK